MIKFKDFKRTSSWMGLQHSPIYDVMQEMSSWLEQNKVNVVNVETIHHYMGGGSTGISVEDDGFRVWYKL